MVAIIHVYLVATLSVVADMPWWFWMDLEDWRVPIGDSGIMELVADILDAQATKGEEARVELQIQTLRLCGNTCAEKGGFEIWSPAADDMNISVC